MMEVIRLVRIGFDSMENRNPVYEEELGVFSSYASLEDWAKTQPPIRIYAGYDNKIYPQFRTEIKFVR